MPSVLSFKQAIIGGYGYGLLPVIDVGGEIKSKRIIQLNQTKDFSIPLFLHKWDYQREHIKKLTEIRRHILITSKSIRASLEEIRKDLDKSTTH